MFHSFSLSFSSSLSSSSLPLPFSFSRLSFYRCSSVACGSLRDYALSVLQTPGSLSRLLPHFRSLSVSLIIFDSSDPLQKIRIVEEGRIRYKHKEIPAYSLPSPSPCLPSSSSIVPSPSRPPLPQCVQPRDMPSHKVCHLLLEGGGESV